MTETATPPKITKASVLKLAKKLYGTAVTIRKNKSAPTQMKREEMRCRLAQLRSRLVEIGKELQDAMDVFRGLTKTARFVCDVNGDHPSIEQLGVETKKADRMFDLLDEETELRDSRITIESVSQVARYEIVQPAYLGWSVHARADSLPVLHKQLKQSTGG
jgi:hypothetical protein